MPTDPRLDQLRARWLHLRRQGRPVSPEELTADCPSLAEPLRRQIRDLQADDLAVSYPDEATPGLNWPEGRPAVPGLDVLAEAGRSETGAVYRARRAGRGEPVAVKVLLAPAAADPAVLARCRADGQAVTALGHPHLAPVLDEGTVDGRPYVIRPWYEGDNLAARLRGTPLPPRQAARLAATLANAVQAAHAAGVAHLRLKPSNILFTADGEPVVADFGLAPLGLHGCDPAAPHAVPATPSYLAPEQALGRVGKLGPRTDVYALGAILYELLTGRPPFRAATRRDTLDEVVSREPVPVRLLNPQVERDLETICLRCLEKEPADRYATAGEVADDLDRYLQGQAIHSRDVGMLDRLARTLGRIRPPGDVDLLAWGNTLAGWAVLVVVSHLAVFLLARTGRPEALGWVLPIRILEFFLLTVIYRLCRPGNLLDATSFERRMGVIVLGFLGACTVARWVSVRTLGPEDAALAVYPQWAALAGMAFFMAGATLWPRCYAYSGVFLLAALLMPLALPVAPLAYGLVWAAVLVSMGCAFRRFGRQEHAARTAAPPAP